ncbi:MAG: hypothetical protein V1779_08030 [bacterium]
MTAQVREILIIKGEKHGLSCVPAILENAEYLEKLEPDKGKKYYSGIFGSTACWRRYRATWEIKEDKFYFVDIEGAYRKKNMEPIFAEWFSGIIKYPQGKLLKRVHLGFFSVYEEEVLIRIESGVVLSIEIIDNRKRYFDEWTFRFWDRWQLQ